MPQTFHFNFILKYKENEKVLRLKSFKKNDPKHQPSIIRIYISQLLVRFEEFSQQLCLVYTTRDPSICLSLSITGTEVVGMMDISVITASTKLAGVTSYIRFSRHKEL